MKNILCVLFSALFSTAASADLPTDTFSAIIDVRTAEEFNEGHLAGAVNIPYDIIDKKIDAAVPDKNAEIMLYCRSGRRSGVAFKTLEKMGYKKVHNGGAYKDLVKRKFIIAPEKKTGK